MKKEDIYYQAMLTRDHRFDGKFFLGVKTTGIYCRPICPAKPKRENIEFFSNRLAAEKAGYRPCMRCRPESAPNSPLWIGSSEVVARALKVLHSEDMFEFNEDDFAKLFGISSRHLRRLFTEEIGKTPKYIASINRLNLARQLIVETSLPITQIAFASGFESIRRFNDAFKERFKKTPRDIRGKKTAKEKGIEISLSYRPPFDYEGLLNVYKNHKIGHLEWFENNKMVRIISYGKDVGKVTISNDERKSCLIVEIDFPDTTKIYSIISKVRRLFDIDSDPVVIAKSLELDSKVKKILKKYPGIRLPSGWCPFEVAISAILGQLVSIERGRSLVDDLIETAGKKLNYNYNGNVVRAFPTPNDIINTDISTLKTTGRRKETLVAFAKAIVSKEITLEETQNVEIFIDKLLLIKGIGPWTANYIAMKAIRSTDTFPTTDLILARALELHNTKKIELMSPWRGYVAALFWRYYGNSLQNKKGSKK
jgi:AraC family transcriptional regulator of adaptative response / DNA-3-methyladenine glycosylase II